MARASTDTISKIRGQSSIAAVSAWLLVQNFKCLHVMSWKLIFLYCMPERVISAIQIHSLLHHVIVLFNLVGFDYVNCCIQNPVVS
uniref:Uncharacterized protein n=1 Tax=Arundo donax TaxID=35708 RepID=A0A0A8XPG2_ARUDO